MKKFHATAWTPCLYSTFPLAEVLIAVHLTPSIRPLTNPRGPHPNIHRINTKETALYTLNVLLIIDVLNITSFLFMIVLILHTFRLIT